MPDFININTNLSNDILKSLNYIGYPKNYVRLNYQFSDFIEPTPVLRRTNIGVFGREPFDYRSACISINFLNNDNNKLSPTNFRAFGAPHIFFINNGYTERWSNDSHDIRKVETIKTAHLISYIRSNRKHLNPEYIIRQKSDFSKLASFQPDLFIDSGLIIALDRDASIRVDYLIRNLIANIEKSFKLKNQSLDTELIFKLIFFLLTAKLLSDRDIATQPKIDFLNYKSVLEGVSNFYKSKIINRILSVDKNIIQSATDEISKIISLKNLSIDTLTYIYENTFVSPDSRKKLGIHSTPSYVADYILSQIPFKNIPLGKLSIFDPMCGHGIFLVSAMRKLKNDLPIEWDGKKRHNYFTKHLRGVEIDSFALEVANMCLTLADFPESNGWQLTHDNIFNGKILENYCATTNVLLGNPPFEYENYNSKQYPKPALLLNRAVVALPKDSYIGIVLPSSFLDSVDYRKTREFFLINYSLLSVTNLPPNTFLYSTSETSVIIAKKANLNKTIYYSEVDSSHKDKFKYDFSKTWEVKLKSNYFQQRKTLKVLILNELWSFLNTYDNLDSIASIKIGVQNEPSLVTPKRDYKLQGFIDSVQAIVTPEQDFYQYTTNQKYYIPSDPKRRRRNAWNYNWSIPKLLVPTGRMSAGPWKFAAAIDYMGRYATRNFFAIWTKEKKINIEVISAILNSPLASAYVYANSTGRSIPKRIYKSIPIPSNLDLFSEEITLMVKIYLKTIEAGDFISAYSKVLEIDAFILKLYKLPPQYEFNLLKLFYNQTRPVPFKFMEYYPKDYTSWIPLHIFISEKYKNSTLTNFIDFFPKIKNEKTIFFLENLQ